MKIEILYSKIHNATITDANLNYKGSITIDKALLRESKLFVGQKVEIANLNNGERFSTYVIEGKENSKVICLNGAAARKVQVGDKIIIMAYATCDIDKAESFKPTIIMLDEDNDIITTTNKE